LRGESNINLLHEQQHQQNLGLAFNSPVLQQQNIGFNPQMISPQHLAGYNHLHQNFAQ